MPVVATSPYPTAEEVLQATRVKINDAAISIDGDILADTQPFVFPMLEERYEYFQDRLIQAGVNTYSKYGTINAVPVIAVADPATQIQIDYVGCFDGLHNTDQPVIPVDLLEPLEFWERQNVAGENTNPWREMKQASDSISTRAQTSTFGIWDWEDDTLFLPGATQVNDLKLKYLAYAPQITGPDSVLLMARCKPAMASLMAEAVCKARGGLESAAAFKTDAEAAIQAIIARTAEKEQYASFVRRPFRTRRGR
jgi:hypothetical protein